MASRELRALTGWVLRGALFVVVNSRNTGRILRESWGVPDDRIQLLYPGVDTRLFIPSPRDKETRGALGWGDRPVVLTVGRLQRRKGHDTMIRALLEIRRSIPDILYAIAGDGEQRSILEDLVAAEGLAEHVQFLGRPTDAELVQCYQQCDLFVLPNRAVGRDIEGFGLVLVEAQACGKPVVAGASGGTVEAMHVPETGLVIPCEHEGELSRTVVGLLSDPHRLARMGDAARRWAVERHDWDSVAIEAGRILGMTGSALFEGDDRRTVASDVIHSGGC
jgi:phosphatidylinositol alpha-1,6-mannosyltransferase